MILNTKAHHKARRLMTAVLLLMFAALGAAAQDLPGIPQPGLEEIEPVTDDELETFAAAFNEVQALQSELDSEMNETLNESDLDPQRFFEINELVQQTTPGTELPGVGDEELAAYEATFERLIDVQYEIQMRMVEAVLDHDMDIDRFNEIAMAIQFDETLLNRLRPYLEEEVEGV